MLGMAGRRHGDAGENVRAVDVGIALAECILGECRDAVLVAVLRHAEDRMQRAPSAVGRAERPDAAGIAAVAGARGPRIPVAPDAGFHERIDDDERLAEAIGAGLPAVAVAEGEHVRVERRRELDGDGLAAVVELAREYAGDERAAAVARAELREAPADDDALARREDLRQWCSKLAPLSAAVQSLLQLIAVIVAQAAKHIAQN